MTGNFLTPKRMTLLTEMYGARAGAVARLISGYTLPTQQLDPVLDLFFKSTRPLKQDVIDYLIKSRGVPATALMHDGDGNGMPLCEAHVMFDDRGRFEFSTSPDGGMRAIVVIARDEAGDAVDLVGWSPRTNAVASYVGRAVCLGAHDLDYLELDGTVPVRRGVIEWLVANRKGIVITDSKRAWRLLLEMHVEAAGVEHGSELSKMLRPPQPKISVREALCEGA